jgi:succinoglycan biosynthesis transport protein ExoP
MDYATLASIRTTIRRRWWLVVLLLAAVLTADAIVSARSPRAYVARASLLIGPSTNLDHGQLVYSVDALGRSLIVGTYADVLATDMVRRDALERLGVSTDTTDTGVNIKTAALAQSAVIQVIAEAPDPVLAAAVANAVGQVGQARMSQLYPIYDLTVVTAATPPSSAYRPNLVRNGSLGLLLGLLLGGLAAYLYDAVSITSGQRRH